MCIRSLVLNCRFELSTATTEAPFSLCLTGDLAFLFCRVTRFSNAITTAITAPLSNLWTDSVLVSPDTYTHTREEVCVVGLHCVLTSHSDSVRRPTRGCVSLFYRVYIPPCLWSTVTSVHRHSVPPCLCSATIWIYCYATRSLCHQFAMPPIRYLIHIKTLP